MTSRIVLALGFWILISPWIFGFTSQSLAKWSDVLVGLVLILLSAWEVFGHEKGSSPVKLRHGASE